MKIPIIDLRQKLLQIPHYRTLSYVSILRESLDVMVDVEWRILIKHTRFLIPFTINKSLLFTDKSSFHLGSQR
ncbi:hypothetical protein [Candidatus Protochlamydia amoebophila]|uniref:hypothetical protein n=1 Tax=Candidatus Protochlamydia amoebophila TaxID=362787 RepID=UPI001BCA37AE|nr:hypothetical protein [Candidatus Protochlamydia amoebophila]